ncbi:hypothetical protein ABH944_007444 [Caballeronia udeis]|jgi:hypothetical protein|uniref:Uncharacterized protein n=1 Tax=Caballeronia udeis TaxID=1232866 RepID=A0ABW8MY10_9BURK
MDATDIAPLACKPVYKKLIREYQAVNRFKKDAGKYGGKCL